MRQCDVGACTWPSIPGVKPREFVVTEALHGARLDRAAAQLAAEGGAGLSRARLKKAIDEGAVRVNGRYCPKGGTVATGDVISVATEQVPTPDAPATPAPEAPLDVRFEGEGVLVVDKPAGVPSAPLRPGETGTLANALVGHYPDLAGVGYGPREPGLLHRLDTDTSGLLVVARSAAAFDTLKVALKEGRLDKTYLVVCKSDGLPDRGVIEFPLANHPKDQRRVYACVHPRDVMRYAPRPAATRFVVKRRGGTWALAEVTVAKALRHQIRVHFSAFGFPLAGDKLYGGEMIEGLDRHALHASRVAFAGAKGVAKFDVSSELPGELVDLLDR